MASMIEPAAAKFRAAYRQTRIMMRDKDITVTPPLDLMPDCLRVWSKRQEEYARVGGQFYPHDMGPERRAISIRANLEAVRGRRWRRRYGFRTAQFDRAPIPA